MNGDCQVVLFAKVIAERGSFAQTCRSSQELHGSVAALPEKGATMAKQSKIYAVGYGIDLISKQNWLSTFRRMVSVLGWDRRRRYEQLFDGL